MNRLAPNRAPTHLNGDMPKTPDSIIEAEFELRSRLARTLHFPSLAERGIFRYPELEFMKVWMKSMVCPRCHDLFEFAVARHNCSKHAPQHTSIRQEPPSSLMTPLGD